MGRYHLEQFIERWYIWLGTDSQPLFNPSDKRQMLRLVALYYDEILRLQEVIATNTERFGGKEPGDLVQQLENVERIRRGVLLKRQQSLEGTKQQLMQRFEQWYAWLGTDPKPLFNGSDNARMKEPVIYFHEAIDWLSRTTMANTGWFFKEGSQIVMNRWLKGDYNAYE